MTALRNRQQCYVVDTGKSGCFVRLQGGLSGRVLLKHLSDRFVSNPRQEFPPGKLVAGKVLAKVSFFSTSRYDTRADVCAYVL